MPRINGEWISDQEMRDIISEEIKSQQDQRAHQAALEAHQKGPDFCDCYECSCANFDPAREREDALANENAPMSMHMAEYARNYGADRPDQAWIGMPDGATWEANPSYQGPPVPHPEDSYYEEDN
jgi:acetyl-CoA acetyltransferase